MACCRRQHKMRKAPEWLDRISICYSEAILTVWFQESEGGNLAGQEAQWVQILTLISGRSLGNRYRA